MATNTPKVIDFSPSELSSTLLPDITISWSQDMEDTQFSTVTGIVRLFDAQTNSSIAITIDATNLKETVVTPTANLLPDNNYLVTILSGIQDTIGRRSTKAYSFYFKTPASSLVAPAGLTPVDASYVVDTPITFSWEAVSGATGYTIQISETLDFSSVVHTGTPTLTTYAPVVSYTLNQTYCWRVRATDGSGVGGWSDTYQFNYTAAGGGSEYNTLDSLFYITSTTIPESNEILAPTYPSSFTITFSQNVTATPEDYITVKQKSYQLFSTTTFFADSDVTITSATNVVTITFNTDIEDTTEFLITVSSSLPVSSGDYTLGESSTFSFVTKPSPLYVDIDAINQEFPTGVNFTNTDLIKTAYKGSLVAKQFWLSTSEEIDHTATLADVVSATDPTSLDFFRLAYAFTKCFYVDLLIHKSILSIGTSIKVGQYNVDVSDDLLKALQDLKARADEERINATNSVLNGLTPAQLNVAVAGLYSNFTPTDIGVKEWFPFSTKLPYDTNNQTFYGQGWKVR